MADMLKKKLLDSFLEASEIDKMIVKQQITPEVGVPILRRFIKDYVREDIKLLDESTYTMLMSKTGELDTVNNERKQEIKSRIIVDDDMDERNMKVHLLRKEDHARWHRELVLIQTIMRNKQWFTID